MLQLLDYFWQASCCFFWFFNWQYHGESCSLTDFAGGNCLGGHLSRQPRRGDTGCWGLVSPGDAFAGNKPAEAERAANDERSRAGRADHSGGAAQHACGGAGLCGDYCCSLLVCT